MPIRINIGVVITACALAYIYSLWWILVIPAVAIASPWRLTWTKATGWKLEKEEGK